MTRLWTDDHALTMQVNDYGYPFRFVWRQCSHQIGRVHQYWRVDTDWWSEAGAVQRIYWAVTTTDGLFVVLYQEQTSGEWYISHVYD